MNILKFFLIFITFAILIGCNLKHPSTIIKYTSYGSFASEESEIKFYPEGNKTLVCLETNGKELKRRYINEGQAAAASAFYSELQKLPTDSFQMSRTTESITIKSNNENIAKAYNGHWDGFQRLKFVLFDSK